MWLEVLENWEEEDDVHKSKYIETKLYDAQNFKAWFYDK